MSTDIDYWRLFAVIFISFFIHLYMYIIFVERERLFNSSSISSYFEIRQILSGVRLKAIALVYAIPLTASIGILAFVAKSIFTSLRQALLGHVPEYLKDKGLSDRVINSVENAFNQIPEQVDPILVIGLALFFLYPHFKIITKFYRDRAIKTLEVEETIDALATKAAKDLLKCRKYDDIIAILKAIYTLKIPSPADLVDRNECDLLAYQILYLSRDTASKIGTAEALRKVIENVEPRQKDNIPQLPTINAPTLFAGAVWYLIFCAIYVGIIPFFQPIAEKIGIGWPERGKEVQLFISMMQNVFMFSIPVLFGQYTVSSRIARGVKKPRSLSKFLTSALLPFSISMFVGLSFLIFMLQLKTENAAFDPIGVPLYRDNTNTPPLTLTSYAVWFYTLSASLVPVICIFFWEKATVYASLYNKNFFTRNIIFILIGASGFFVSQILFEMRHKFDYMYYHQFLLGAFLSGCLLVAFPAAQVTRRRLTRNTP